ncbi:MAG TPA: DUF4004 family protein [Mobilitalea sp.]|nr:DUF4004 family protein [Mobilitalea sp.]
MNLISKKDLLAITGISYGQLYRWKRERLIPEEWFIKQSAYTGQETFFPREQILSRIKSILDMKDLYSLEELAKILSPETSVATISLKDLEEVDEIDKRILSVLPEVFGKESFEFFEVALTAAISQAASKIGLSEKEMKELLRRSTFGARSKKTTNVLCTVFYVGEEYHAVFSPNPAPLSFDSSIEVKEQLSLSEITDTIKLKYKSLFVK